MCIDLYLGYVPPDVNETVFLAHFDESIPGVNIVFPNVTIAVVADSMAPRE